MADPTRFSESHVPVKVAARSALLALVVGLLGACQVTTGPIVLKRGFQAEFTYAAANQDFLVEVLGAPFGPDRTKLDDAVLAAFQRNYNEFNTRFTTVASDRMLPPYKMVVVFGTTPAGSEDAYCTGSPPPPTAETDGELTTLAIFCGYTTIAYVRTTTAKPANPDDPAFAGMLNELAWRLLPLDDDVKPDFGVPREPLG